jgi:hypothetical protein
MSISYIPNFDGDVEAIIIDPVNVLENDIRLDLRLRDRVAHVGIIDVDGVEGGPSSSSSTESTPTYYEGFPHPIAVVDIIDPEAIYTDDHAKKLNSGLPGSSKGVAIDEYNHLTHSASNEEEPGGRPEPDHGMFE